MIFLLNLKTITITFKVVKCRWGGFSTRLYSATKTLQLRSNADISEIVKTCENVTFWHICAQVKRVTEVLYPVAFILGATQRICLTVRPQIQYSKEGTGFFSLAKLCMAPLHYIQTPITWCESQKKHYSKNRTRSTQNLKKCIACQQSPVSSELWFAGTWHVTTECTDVKYDWRMVFLFFGSGRLVKG